MLLHVYNVSSHSCTQGSCKLIYSELNLPLVITEVQVTEFRDFQVSTSSLAGATAALQVLRAISIPLLNDVLRQLNSLRGATIMFLQTIYFILVYSSGVSKQMRKSQRDAWEHVFIELFGVFKQHVNY